MKQYTKEIFELPGPIGVNKEYQPTKEFREDSLRDIIIDYYYDSGGRDYKESMQLADRYIENWLKERNKE